MNHHKFLITTFVIILSSMPLGSCLSVTDQIGVSSLSTKKELVYAINDSGPQEEWNHTFGGMSGDIGTGVKPVIGGGYIITGIKDLTGYYDAGDCWLIKTDSYGKLEWEKTYGGTDCDVAEDVWQTSDRGFVITGTTNSFGAGSFDMWLIKTDENGNELWNRTFGGRKMDYGTSVQQTTDGGYIIGGFTYSYGMGGDDAWLVKVDAQGNVEWNKTFGDAVEGEYFMCVQQTQDGGYIAAGCNYLDNNGNSDMFVVKVDSNGNQEWEKLLGSPYVDNCWWIIQTIDGGYILTGQSSPPQYQSEDLALFKIDHNGNEEWKKYYDLGPFCETGTAVEQTNDTGYIVSGVFFVDEYQRTDAILLKTDVLGNEEWRVTFGGIESDECLEVHQTEDGGYITAGFTNSYSLSMSDAWLIKFDAFENQRPNTPSRPSRLSLSKIHREYTFIVSTTDPNGDQLFYSFDFGDGIISHWYGPYESGEECTASHIYRERGNYQVKVKARDGSGAESDWSDPLPIATYTSIRQFFKWLIEQFPNTFALLRYGSGF